MTDLTPNDLSPLSDEEFMALCPQGEHAPGPEPLSTAAQAVLDAAEPCIAPSECPGLEAAIAAALQAVADQVVPVEPYYENCDVVREDILAIAAELKALDD